MERGAAQVSLRQKTVETPAADVCCRSATRRRLWPMRDLLCPSRNYPTLENIAKKKKLMDLREEAGAVLDTAQFGSVNT